jgi:hypothetical protein
MHDVMKITSSHKNKHYKSKAYTPNEEIEIKNENKSLVANPNPKNKL